MPPALSPVPLPAGQQDPPEKAFCRRHVETSLCPEERHPFSRVTTKLLAKLKDLIDVIRASWGLFRIFWDLS